MNEKTAAGFGYRPRFLTEGGNECYLSETASLTSPQLLDSTAVGAAAGMMTESMTWMTPLLCGERLAGGQVDDLTSAG